MLKPDRRQLIRLFRVRHSRVFTLLPGDR